MDEDALPTTWWDDKKYASANYGAAELKELFGKKNFDFSKSNLNFFLFISNSLICSRSLFCSIVFRFKILIPFSNSSTCFSNASFLILSSFTNFISVL